jgi:hypothetical protein
MAALPLDVRKGSAFPAPTKLILRLSLGNKRRRIGKPEAFHTSAGKCLIAKYSRI